MADINQNNYDFLRKDEYDIDFEDTSAFAVARYNDIIEAIDDEIVSQSDRKTINEKRDSQTIHAEIQHKTADPAMTATGRKLLNQLQAFPRTLYDLVEFFQYAVQPDRPNINPLWGLVHLTFELSYESIEKLKKTVDWVCRLRRVIELFNRCLDSCKEQEINEARIAIVESFDAIFSAFLDSAKYLRSSSTDVDLINGWPAFDAKIIGHITILDGTVKHMSEVLNLASANRQRTQDNLAARRDADSEPEDTAIFPIKMLPPRQENSKFYGREKELERINAALDWNSSENLPLRTYTIYGRRGVGKTELALEYAYSNPAGFDAIFWVGCHTSLILRQTFTDMAKAVNLPGADKQGNDEENQLAVLQWLRKTRCHWLMIFDHAETDHILKGYWPMGANGAILITSRKYYNFMNDNERKGDTIKPFDQGQSFDLLCQFLGYDWQDQRHGQLVRQSEVKAANNFLAKLEGLALAIQQAAILIKNEKVGSPTIEATFDLFEEHARSLPERQAGKRSATYHSLDTLWNMNFQLLSENARQLLSILSMLSPDTTYIELFLPPHQAVLNGKLSFCKQHPDIEDEHIISSTPISPTQALEEALEELVKAELIRRDDQVVTVHREIQEAMNYHSSQDLQESFDLAVLLVNEAFPKRLHGNSLFEQWSICSMYIHDAFHLIDKFAEYTRPGFTSRLKGTDELVELIGNAAWYLYETSSYDEALQIITVGYTACVDKESLQYADLCNTAGVCYTEKNFLSKCRSALETSLRIRREKLEPDDIDIAASTHNMGNLETAAGNYDKAMEYFNEAVAIRLAQGDKAVNQLALLYLCIGRAYSLQKDVDNALKIFNKAETLFVQTMGADKHYMSHIHYAYGNIEYQASNWLAARRSYSDTLRIALTENAIHPITAAAYYKLGKVEFKLGDNDLAKAHLTKARSIAELRSPTRDDGTNARILWMLARVLATDISTAEAAEELRVRAEVARRALVMAGESAIMAEDAEGVDEGILYDALVPVFFR